MINIYNAIAWYFDISFYEAIDIYDEMKSLGEDRQIEQIRRDYLKAHNYYDTDDALDADLMPYRKQPAKVIEQPNCEGKQILDIYMRWEV